MFNMNIEWDDQPKGYHRHRHRQTESKGFFSSLFGSKKEEDRHAGHVYYYTSSRPNAPRRAETISALPPGVKMPASNKPEVTYGADGSKYLVIPPRRSNSSSRPRQVIVTSGHTSSNTSPTPRRKDSTASSHRDTRSPRRSNSTSRPTSPPVAQSHRAPRIVGDPELVKHSRRPSHSRRASTR